MDIEQLYKQAITGDAKAERELFSKLTDRFEWLAKLKISNPDDAEDVAQKALQVIFSKYREAAIDYSFAAWAHKVLTHEIWTYYRSQRTRRKLFTPWDETADASFTSDIDHGFRRRFAMCWKELVEKTPRYARVITMKREGHSTSEICEGLGVDRSVLYVLLSRARRALKDCLERGIEK